MHEPIDLLGAATLAVAVGTANVAIAAAVAGSRSTVLLTSTTNCYWNSGATNAVTAANTDKFLPANVPMKFRLPASHLYVAMIRSTADGIASIITVG